MSREYAKVAPTYWTGDTGRAIRELGGAAAQLLGQYLLSCPHGNSFGLYRLPISYIETDLALKRDEIVRALDAINRAGFARYDAKAEVVFVVNMAAGQVVEYLEAKDRRVKWIRKEVTKLARMPFFGDFLERYAEPWSVALFDFEAPSKPLGSPIEGASAECRSPIEASDSDSGSDSGSDSDSSIGIAKPLRGDAESVETKHRLRNAFARRFERETRSMFQESAKCDWEKMGRWFDFTASIREVKVGQLIEDVLEHWFTDPWVVREKFPVGAFAKNYPNFVDRKEPQRGGKQRLPTTSTTYVEKLGEFGEEVPDA